MERTELPKSAKPKSRKTWAVIIYIIIGLGIIGTIGKNLETTNKVNNFESWSTLETNDFSIKYPSNWIIDSTKSESSDYMILPKPVKNIDLKEDGFFTIKKSPNEMTELSLNEQLIHYKNDFLQTLPNAEILQLDTGINQSYKYIKVIYLAPLKFKDEDVKAKSMTYIIFDKHQIYGLAYACGEIQFEKNSTVYNRIISSFTIK